MTIQIKKINFKHSFIFFLFCNIISLPFIKAYNLSISPLVCLLLILIIGVSHGSLDHIKGRKLLKIFKINNFFKKYYVEAYVVDIEIMLKNIAEKIDLLEQKRVTESTSWKEDIENYKDEITVRREEDLKLFESQLQELDKKRLDEAAEFEKRELASKYSIRN